MSIRAWFIHLFTPYERNNHRARVLHIDALAVYVFLFMCFHFSIGAIHGAIPDVLGYATDIHLEQLLAATNQRRKEAGLQPLTLNSKLSQAAAAKAADMFQKNYWAHTSPDGLTPWEFITGAGYSYTLAGENLAKNFTTSEAVVDAWMASPTHRENIVKSGYKEIGFAIVNGVLNGEETTLVVQMFGATEQKEVAANGKNNSVIVGQALAVEQSEPVALPVTEAQTIPPQAVTQVVQTPQINIPTLQKDVVYSFVALMLAVLAIDAIVVARRKIVRIAGHNSAHFLFLCAVSIALGSVSGGALL